MEPASEGSEHRDSHPTDTRELKVSESSIRWQLPLAPVFHPTSHMRHGKWELPVQSGPLHIFVIPRPNVYLVLCCISALRDASFGFLFGSWGSSRLFLGVSIPPWPELTNLWRLPFSFLPNEIMTVPTAKGCFNGLGCDITQMLSPALG